MLSTYPQVVDALDTLEGPAQGMLRVYRGQIEDYPEMKPSGLRKPIPKASHLGPVFA